MKNRIWEIDFLRFLAITLMVIFHFVYDLKEFANVDIDYNLSPWKEVGKTAALLFIFVSGISSGLSRKNFKRGAYVFLWGIVITIITYILFPKTYVRFGILHFLGISMLISPFLLKINNLLLLVLAGIIAYNPLKGILWRNSLLLPLGIMYKGFSSMDYYPLIPYLAPFILGIIVYKIYYYPKKSIFPFNFHNPLISFISQKSLWIYLIHQPILLAMIYIFTFICN
ncbi:Uncharacterized membrane protein [Anaerobranca californiensis DSM 14826]|jgi:uncharacterized membrane protein|uniref:Uncharacterized membrane protein n=1 Tax=Anaerobranca californiensis DSM 14826 TaxID=1120989 RepID=A0A1M6MQ87_9FIRM|nr:heparan-alpha-glucosaminide N-acetyltransferase [Anaerobranca californiensis]SHJ85658.1 Uncharacterized membrane protein [Anaerobranca californiensis DSM 14826]